MIAASDAVAHATRPARIREAVAEAGPVCLVAAGTTLGLATAQGGYFSTSWAWASTGFLWLIGLWTVASGRTDAGRPDLAFCGLLGLFTAWMGLSITWSVAPSLSVLELQRALVLLSGVGAALLLARRNHVGLLALTLLGGITGITGYALASRLFPMRFDSFDPTAVYRLSEPIGYWNGLGILAVLGLLVALALVAEGTHVVIRSLAAASTVLSALALYFTFSRGSWLALGFGFAFALALSPRRLRLIVTAAALALPAGLGIVAATRLGALTNRHVELQAAVDDGRRLAVLTIALCIASAGLATVIHAVDARATIPSAARTAIGAVVVGLALAVGATAITTYGSPITIAQRAWGAFDAPPPTETDDLNSRLLSLSSNGRVDLWRAAFDIYAEHRVLGGGAGSFERFWRARPDATVRVRDAHGLYIETLAELGPLGLSLLIAALAVPLVASLRARRTPLVSALAGAYVAFLIHAGSDWDWELAGVTLSALLIGAALVAAARGGGVRLVSGTNRIALGSVVGLAVIASILGGLGNSALANSFSATDRKAFDEALSDAVRARRLMPWSGRPWLAQGEAELAAGNLAAAAASFRQAIERDAGDWRAWLDLAIATNGTSRTAALARARSLYPRSTEIERTARELTKG